jgi:hypothetical protein
LSFLLCICLLYNKISDKVRTDLPGTEERREERVEEGGRVEK